MVPDFHAQFLELNVEVAVTDLLASIPGTAVVPGVRAALGLSERLTDQVVQAFDDFVARPLAANLTKLHGRDLAKRNPMIYTRLPPRARAASYRRAT